MSGNDKAANDDDRSVVQLSNRREHQAEGIFGCPVCRLHSGYYQVYREFWFYCHVHRTKWLDDAFWTDTWPTPEEVFRAIDQLAGYREVVPFYALAGTAEEQAAFRARTAKALKPHMAAIRAVEMIEAVGTIKAEEMIKEVEMINEIVKAAGGTFKTGEDDQDDQDEPPF